MIVDNIEKKWQKLWNLRNPNIGDHLRFELAEHVHGLPGFFRAYNRISAIANIVFPNNLIGVVAYYPNQVYKSKKSKSGFKELRSKGFQAKKLDSWETKIYDDDEVYHKFRSYDLKGHEYDKDCLYWYSVINRSRNKPELSCWLLDPDELIMLYIYDDRGMALISADIRKLKPIYDHFNSWILDYDRERIDKIYKNL